MILFCVLLYLSFSGVQSVTTSICSSHEFPCTNGECIEKRMWCDGEIDCVDESDEIYCQRITNFGTKVEQDPNRCRNDQNLFMCTDGPCIPNVGRCDGYKSCNDNSDEKNCHENDNIGIYEYSNKRWNKSIAHREHIDDSSSFTDLDPDNYRTKLASARSWLLSQQNEDYGWGDYTQRAVIAMYLSKTDVYEKEEKDLLMDKQLDIQLSIALTRNSTNELSVSELALYINALTAACSNPRNFYGYNLVGILRDRVDVAHHSRAFVSPYVYLTLCINNNTRHHDYTALQDISRSSASAANKMDIIALSVLASSCMIKDPLYNHPQYRRNIVIKLFDKIQKIGMPGNIYELAIVVQALNEARVDPSRWNREESLDYILSQQDDSGSFGGILATYYTVPILSGRSIMSLVDHCFNVNSQGFETPLAVLKNTKKNKIEVLYSLLFGEPVEMTQSIKLKVAEGTTFLDVMRIAQVENPNFRFSLDSTKNTPFVYSIGGIPNDAERGLYWTLHTTRNGSYGEDIRKHIPQDHEETIFWLKAV